MNFGNNTGTPDYSQLNLDDFSDDSSDNGGGSDFASKGINRQKQLFQEQDHGLEMLGQSAERLGKMSMAINEELGFQNKMLDEMEEDLDEAAEDLNLVTRKTKEFIERAGGTKNCLIIAILLALVILLLFLVLYT